MKKIPVCFITGEMLPFAAATLMVNLLETANAETFYDFYCFVAGNVSKEDKDKLLALKCGHENKCEIHLINTGNRYLDKASSHKIIPNACWLKFAIIDLIPLDKILYLDLDILVKDDLTSLFDIDLQENYIAGVERFGKSPISLEKIKQKGFDYSEYINAGIMLMNLKKMREDNVLQKLEELMPYFPDTIDQDIFNIVCKNKILLLDVKYNYIYDYRLFNSIFKSRLNDSAILKMLEDKKGSEVITHYIGPNKPWKYFGMYGSEKWYSYYKKTPFYDKFNRKPYLFALLRILTVKIFWIIRKRFR